MNQSQSKAHTNRLKEQEARRARRQRADMASFAYLAGNAERLLRREAQAAKNREQAKAEAQARGQEIRDRIALLQQEAQRLEVLAAGPDAWGAAGSLGHIETVLGQLLGMEN